jgi:biopolymer transport protein ExbD
MESAGSGIPLEKPMAEIQNQDKQRKQSVYRRKKLSTRVDLTPMVDLGFLLITFFIFTTTMHEAKAMKLVVPDDSPVINPNTAPESKTISLILGADNRIQYYQGRDIGDSKFTTYAASGIRTVISQKIQAVQKKFGPGETPVVIIKPTAASSYKNLVDVLDEMLICDIKKYVLTDADPAEIVDPAAMKYPPFLKN